MRAEQFTCLGYQRVLSYEVQKSGGFSWWGRPPAITITTAYTLMALTDMSKVYPVDEAVIARIQKWLLSLQNEDGSFQIKGQAEYLKFTHPVTASAYVTWALLESGIKGQQVRKAVAFVADNYHKVQDDSYALALCANVLALADPAASSTARLIELLKSRAKRTSEGSLLWPAGGGTLYNGRGTAGTVEATALAAMALKWYGKDVETLRRVLNFLVSARTSGGTWGSTQATVLALRALCLAAETSMPESSCEITMQIGQYRKSIIVEPEKADLMQLVAFEPHQLVKGDNTLNIKVGGPCHMLYQVVTRYYLPWDKVPPAKQPPLSLNISYDRTELRTNDILTANVSVRYNGAHPTFMVIIDLGIPPGFTPDAGCFAELVGQKKIARYSITGRQITVYLGDVKPGYKLDFSYTLKAKYPIKAKTPRSVIYEYYNPASRDEVEPAEIHVK
jgi:hypothetical protein